jgi:D-alanine-D-alanine ligase
MGGWSDERPVSLKSGTAVCEALSSLGHCVRAIDVDRNLVALMTALSPRPDTVFNALHGQGGEDGVIQGVLDVLGIPYTHSGVLTSAMAMDKAITKQLVVPLGVRTAPGLATTRGALLAGGEPVARPFVVKPARNGSTFGVRLVRPGDNQATLVDPGPEEEPFVVERYIFGRELTVGVLDAPGAPGVPGVPGDAALGITEIEFATELFDYNSKYTAGHARHVLPADIPPTVAALAQDWAVAVHRALGCAGVSRSDFRWDDSLPGTEGLVFLEINTQPGLTAVSLVPEQAAAAGIPFPKLCQRLVEQALWRG